MPLPASGAISLNQIHVEAGGTSGTQASLNDSDIRGLISKASGASMSFSEWYGASAGTSFTITEGSSTGSGYSNYGYSTARNFGSISPTTLGGAPVRDVYSNSITVKGSTSFDLYIIASGNQSTSWFSSVSIAGTAHAQSTFTRSYNSSTNRTTFTKSLSAHVFDGSGTTTVVFS